MKPKPLTRPSELVLSAIYNLDMINGSSTGDIVNYISNNYGINSEEIKERVEAAIKRGLSFGLISKSTNGLYMLREMTELPDIPAQRRLKRKRKRIARPKREKSLENSRGKCDGRKKRVVFSKQENNKRARLDGENSKNQQLTLNTACGCTNLGYGKR